MGSCISNSQFMIHILNYLTSEYELQLALMERRIDDTEKPLTIEEIQTELSPRFERQNLNSEKERNTLNEQVLLSGQVKGKCRNCDKIGHEAYECKNKSNQNGGNICNSFSTTYCLVIFTYL